MTRRFLSATLALLLALTVACCSPGGGSDTGIVTPPPGLTDEIVVPAELAEEYQHWVDVDWQPVLYPLDLDSLTLSQKRSLTYYNYKNATDVTKGSFGIVSPQGADGEWADEIQQAVARIDSHVYYDGGYYRNRNTYYTILHSSNITLGEMAWMGDWLYQNYPDLIHMIVPTTDL